MFARILICGLLPRELRVMTAPFVMLSYPGNGCPVAAFINVKLDTPKAVLVGFTVRIPLFAERKRVSVASSFTRYVPGTEGVTEVVA